jgi:hypothetical protein
MYLSLAFFLGLMGVSPTQPSLLPDAPVFVVNTVRTCRATTDALIPPIPSAECPLVPTGNVDPQGTSLWMFGEITIPPSVERSRVPMAVLMQGMASSAIYWDGRQVGLSGVVSATAADEVPGQFVHVAPLRADELQAGVHRIAVHLSSFRGPVRVHAPVHVLAVAPLDHIRNGVGGGSSLMLLAVGALLLAAVYFAAVARRVTPRRDAILVAVLITSAFVQGGAELWRTMLPISYVEQIWRLLAIVLAATVLGAVLVAYCAQRFDHVRRAWYVTSYSVVAVLAVALLPSFDTRTLGVIGAALVIAIAATARSARRGVPGARPIAVVLIALLATGIIESEVFLDRDLFLGLTVLAIVLLMDQVAQVRRVQESAAEARRERERLEVELIRRRLTPHWLLNMLNAVAAWIEEEPTTAVRMVNRLGEEFHRLAHPVDAKLIPVDDELAACDRLLELMSLRSGRIFTLETVDVSATLMVPPGVLHTLVENALTHGQYRHGAVFTIRQSDDRGARALTFEAPCGELDEAAADDNCRSASTDDVTSDGFGLTYVRARLSAAFGESASLVHGPREDGGWRTVMRLGAASA